MAIAENTKNLVWIDMEFSGLDPEKEAILEIATIITDSDLNILATGPVIAVHQEESLLEAMDDWNQSHHSKSGLTNRVRQSTETHASAERATLDFVASYCAKNTSPLCGNSIHQDRRFLYKYMPELSEYLHYRNIDVSTLKELAVRWYPQIPLYKKKEEHRALQDIKESIEELRYWRQIFFQNPTLP